MLKSTFFIICVFFLMIFVSCGPVTSKKTIENHNFIILLDLSDRIINKKDQIKTDKEIIKSIWEQYREITKIKSFINSRDIFQIIVADQDGSSLEFTAQKDFQDSLTLDLSKAKRHAMNKKRIKQFESRLNKNTDRLYSLASKSNNPEDYYGADIWKFFNEDISNYLMDGYKNHVFILTDGYLYVKDLRGNEYNFPSVKFKSGNNKVDICMLEISPKPHLDNEFYRLRNVWSNWFESMGIELNGFVKIGSLGQAEKSIDKFLHSSQLPGDKLNPPLGKKEETKTLGTNLNRPKDEKKEPKTEGDKLNPPKDDKDKLTMLEDAEFLKEFVTSSINDEKDKFFFDRLKRIEKILDESFPYKGTTNYTLTCSCKSKIIMHLVKNNLLTSDLERKLNKSCP